jgi:hypothetical protein
VARATRSRRTPVFDSRQAAEPERLEAFLIAIFIGSAVIAFVVGRWWTLLVPLAAVGAFYAGLNAGWWGNGVGDAWQVAMALMMGAGLVAAAVGLAARAAVTSTRGSAADVRDNGPRL